MHITVFIGIFHRTGLASPQQRKLELDTRNKNSCREQRPAQYADKRNRSTAEDRIAKGETK